MRVAARLGVSKRRVEGWEPATLYQYDDGGRLVSSRPEPEWTPLELGWMLALVEFERSTCPECGHDLDEATTTEPEDWSVPSAYPKRCAPCTRIAVEHAQFVEQGNRHLHALRWATVRKDAAWR